MGELVSKNIFAIQESFWFHLGFLVTLVVFWLVCLGLGYVFSKLLSLSGLGFFDKLLGFVVGSAKIFLVFAIFVFIISRIAILHEKLEPYTKTSIVYPILLQSGEFIMNQNIPAVANSAKEVIEDGKQKASQLLDQNVGIPTQNEQIELQMSDENSTSL